MPLVASRYDDLPGWVPASARIPRGQVLRVRLPDPVRRVLRKRRPVSVSGWAARHRVLTMGRFAGMRWRNATTPYLSGIMDAAAAPGVQTVIVCKAPQIGVSEAAHNYVAWAIDMRPGPVLYVYPDQKTGRENAQDRIIPMLRKSRRLREYLTGVDDDETKYRIKLSHMPIYIGWAGSAAALGNKPIRHLILDELDKYTEKVSRETDPVALAEKRTITYQWMRCVWKISTPTIEAGFIWRALTEEAEVVFGYRARCPRCGHLAEMDFENIGWPRDAAGHHPDPKHLITRHLAWYECPGCAAHWDDDTRDRAVAAGAWWSREQRDADGRMTRAAMPLRRCLRELRPRAVGFQLPSWVSRFRSLSEAAAPFVKYLRANKADKNALKDFKNQECAEPWTDYSAQRDEARILSLRDDRPRGLVPDGVCGLTCAVDTQDNGFFYEIRAWGYGLDEESWGVREGFVDSLAGLARLLWEDEYHDAGGRRYVILIALIDAMGHRTAEVYDFCRLNRGRIWPLRGERSMRQPTAWSQIDRYPGTSRAIPGGLKLLRINTTYYKNKLSAKLATNPADPGAWHLHADATQDWAAQMCAETVDEKTGFWINPRQRPNHAWDVSVYNLAAADVLELRFRKRPAASKAAAKAAAQPPDAVTRLRGPRRGYRQPSWMADR